MRRIGTTKFVIAALAFAAVVLFAGSNNRAQDNFKKIYIQSQAMGQAQQLGRSYNVTLIIEELSTADDQKALFEAFTQKGNEGLVNAVSKMHSKGRIAITGTLGYDVNYARQFKMPDGSTKYRVLTDRPLRFGEVWSDSRSSEYNLSAMEVIMGPGNKKNSGVLYPACQFKLDKENEIQIELNQNPWKLVDVRQR